MSSPDTAQLGLTVAHIAVSMTWGSSLGVSLQEEPCHLGSMSGLLSFGNTTLKICWRLERIQAHIPHLGELCVACVDSPMSRVLQRCLDSHPKALPSELNVPCQKTFGRNTHFWDCNKIGKGPNRMVHVVMKVNQTTSAS